MLNQAWLIGTAAPKPKWHGVGNALAYGLQDVGGRVVLLPVPEPVLKPVPCISCWRIVFFIDLGWVNTDGPIYEESYSLAAGEGSRCRRAEREACER